MKTLARFLACITLAACGEITSPAPDPLSGPVGVFRLVSVNGASLPLAVKYVAGLESSPSDGTLTGGAIVMQMDRYFVQVDAIVAANGDTVVQVPLAGNWRHEVPSSAEYQLAPSGWDIGFVATLRADTLFVANRRYLRQR